MARISNPVTDGLLYEKELAEALSAERRSVDPLSTDFDSSADGSTGGESSLWESSDRDDIITDEESDHSTQFSGSMSDYNGAITTETREHMEESVIETTSIIETDSGTEGDDEQPAPRYELRPRTKKQCRPSCMHSGANTSDDEDDTSAAGRSGLSQPTFRRGGRGGGGRGRGGRGGGGTMPAKKKAAAKKSDSLPTNATPISTTDSKFKDLNSFCPLRDVGPHLPPGTDCDALGLFELFFDNSIMDRILQSTYAYAESKKESKKGRFSFS